MYRHCFTRQKRNKNYQQDFRVKTAINKSRRLMSQADSFIRYTPGGSN